MADGWYGVNDIAYGLSADLPRRNDCIKDCANCWKTKLVNAPNRWIPVTERLPENFRYVLLWDSLDKDFFMGVLRDNNEWYVPGYQDEPFNVTYWMPLPEPPKGE